MYVKVFSQIYDGTLCTTGPWEALVTFQQMLILADQDGVVDMTLVAMHRRTTIPLEILRRGVTALMEPDPESRSPGEDGRRIVPVSEGREWGWRIVNYIQYSKIRREEERRAYHRNYWHTRKSKAEDTQQTQQTQQTQPNSTNSTHTDTDTNTAIRKEIVASPRIDGQAVEAYNRILGDALPKVTRMTSTRKSAINARVRDLAERSRVDWWEQYFEVVKSRGFLLGENDRGWRADFDWLLKPAHMQKILEGGYSGTAKKAGGYAVDGIMGRFV